MLRQLALLMMLLLTACDALNSPNPTPTAPDIVKLLATAYISPTPNPEQEAATRAASSPTPLRPTATIIPTETPYIGIFIGEADTGQSFLQFNAPLFASNQSIEPTANASVCATPIDRPYLPAWRNNSLVNQRLGCPIQGGFGFFGQVQLFENGLMYYYPELNALWAIVPERDGLSATVLPRGRFDYLENPPENSTIGMQAPVGLLLPGNVFGDVWLDVEGLRDRMGYAQTEAQEISMGLQRFENGTFLLDGSSGTVLAFVTDGTMLGPFLAPPAPSSTPTPASIVTAQP
ncbi:MAG: hypothetical protein Q9P01_02365 [Anaerolineae bacterium]|nr:hypothetical protein [Anaerolineae bacterium]MDQ7033701.1 hypothetical protein [Anaerolineae bacterium]